MKKNRSPARGQNLENVLKAVKRAGWHCRFPMVRSSSSPGTRLADRTRTRHHSPSTQHKKSAFFPSFSASAFPALLDVVACSASPKLSPFHRPSSPCANPYQPAPRRARRARWADHRLALGKSLSRPIKTRTDGYLLHLFFGLLGSKKQGRESS